MGRQVERDDVLIGRIGSALDGARSEFETLLQGQLPVDQMIATVMARVQDDYDREGVDLKHCHPDTVIRATREACQYAILPDGINSRGWIRAEKKSSKPYAVFEAGYVGLKEYAERTGCLDHCYAQIVRDGDDFEVSQGTDPWIRHRPVFSTDPGRPVIAAYAVFFLPGRTVPVFDVCDIGYLERVESQAKERKGGRSSGPAWQKWRDRLYCKTILKRGLRLIVPSTPPDLQALIHRDNELESGEAPEPATNGTPGPATVKPTGGLEHAKPPEDEPTPPPEDATLRDYVQLPEDFPWWPLPRDLCAMQPADRHNIFVEIDKAAQAFVKRWTALKPGEGEKLAATKEAFAIVGCKDGKVSTVCAVVKGSDNEALAEILDALVAARGSLTPEFIDEIKAQQT